ncbi:hypothetical protein NO2_0719 [Candidatus Termititenax persephonae]|uniref:YobI-like P-loop NTPase domain-containing protein n=1 Tax=Candidatus Termititenax persephonae TaxID=2218525 RepID=A0A388TGA1_9BACT|nr:hypothetical protein NO2_0719 [Candidatus Termititenax persephonae]
MNNEPEKYYALSPKNDLFSEDICSYSKALSWALDNKVVHNIAITGAYGSGKSSFIETFIQKHKPEKKFSFLKISLATFKDPNLQHLDTTDSANHPTEKAKIENPQKLQRLIELSILQQLLYREKDKTLSESRIRKIHRLPNLLVLATAFFLFLFILMMTNIVSIYLLQTDKTISFWTKILSTGFSLPYHSSLLFCAIGCIYVLSIGIRFLNNIKLKLSFQNTEIEIDKDISKSIFNHHLDEIIYFFEATKYNVVVIEDLDRFEQAEIFTKLREINLLLNASAKIGRRIVFIYVLRDDVFKDESRTKFFDFIIPIIPTVTVLNSKEYLLKIKSLDISEHVVKNMALVIDDMRLLYNIVNEFKIYKEKLQEILKNDNEYENKLFALVVYKNLYPQDFVALCKNEGILYSEVNKKSEYVGNKLEEINSEISVIRTKLSELENIKIKDIDELKNLYVMEYLKKAQDVVSFMIDNTEYTFDKIYNDSVFDKFINGNFSCNKFTQRQSYGDRYIKSTHPSSINISDIETILGKYSERRQNVVNLNTNVENDLKTQIESLERKKITIRQEPLSKIYKPDDNHKLTKQHQIIAIMLQNNYVNENYPDYISVFHEGNISRVDKDFLINIKTSSRFNPEYRLNKIAQLIPEIDDIYYENLGILNYSLLEFILKNKADYGTQYNRILELLGCSSEEALLFIDGFIEKEIEIKEFINALCRNYKTFWDVINKKYSKDKKEKYLKIIFEHCDIQALIIQAKNNETFILEIATKKDFSIFGTDKEKIKEFLKKFDIKFTNLVRTTVDDEMSHFLYENNLYEININMLKLVFESKKYSYVDFDDKNYTCVSLADSHIKEYINTHIEKYVVNVFLKLPEMMEKENALLELLNMDFLSTAQKEQIIKHNKTKLSNLEGIKEGTKDSIAIKKILLGELKIEPSWQMLIKFYGEAGNVPIDELNSFLNNIDNATVLSKEKIKEDIVGEEILSAFIKTIILNTEDNCFKLYLQVLPCPYTELDIENLSKTKVTLLIQHKILCASNENIHSLKNHFPSLLELFFQEWADDITKSWKSISLDATDYSMLLEHDNLSLSQKQAIYDKIEEDIFVSDNDLLTIISKIVLKNETFTVSNNILESILLNSSLTDEEKIQILITHKQQISNECVTNFLSQLPNPYPDITNKSGYIKLKDTKLIRDFMSVLKDKNYISSFSNDKENLRINLHRNTTN